MENTYTVYTTKGGYSKWTWAVPAGELTGDDLYRSVRAPHWGQMSIKRDTGEYETIDRSTTYRIPQDIPADTEFRVNW